MILGLDISTSCTGVCVVDGEGNPVHFSKIDLSKIDDFFEKACKVRSHLFPLIEKYSIDTIAVEDYLTSFSRGKSSSGVLFKLATFNGVVQWICYDSLKLKPYAINVINARKINNIIVLGKKKTTESTKDQVLRQVKEIIGEKYVFPTKILSSGPRKGTLINQKHSYDMADAFVIAKAKWLENKENSE